jgi:hypothetical protein
MFMRIFTKLCLSVLFATIIAIMPSFAQNKSVVNGTVTAADTKAPVAYALVHILEVGAQAVTDGKGNFEFKLNPGQYTINISFLGYEPIEKQVTIAEKDGSLSFELQPANFRVEDVVVTATASKAGAATASTISRTAMDHIQSSSLADVMSLLPGASVPDTRTLTLSQASSFSIRGGSSLGTAVIMDGTPMSNNANMQTMGAGQMPFAAASTAGQAAMATPTSGIDMRQISTDNIESVEVIRGIASVEYGDITSGAVIVNSKAGRSPLNVKLTMNPNLYQLSATHGVQLSQKAGALNYSADYAYSQYKPTEGYSHYERVNGQVGYTNTIGKWYTTTTASIGIYRDKSIPTPGDENDHRNALQKENRFRLNTKGTITFDKGWFNNIKYAASFTYTDKNSFYEDQAANAEYTFSTSKLNGEITNSAAGGKVYLEDGSILSGNSFGHALKTPNTYLYRYNIYGEELNTYAQVIANFSGDWGRTSHFIKLGADFRNEGNRGSGKVYDEDCPPMRSSSYGYQTQRDRAYDEIPFINSLGLFAEESFNLHFGGGRNLNIVAGVRYDKIFGMDGVVAPRINASLDIIPRALTIRGGYGVTAKAPTLEMLHPQDAYFDMVNFDNSQATAASQAQKFQVVTTHAYSSVNDNLKMATTKKAEIGVDFQIGKVVGSITAFKDSSDNGYIFTTTADSFHSVDMVRYAANYGNDANQMPTLTESSRDKVLLYHSKPTNDSSYETRGIEASIDFGRINAIRTRFILDGVWTRTESWVKGYNFKRANAGVNTDHMGVFSDRPHSFSEVLSTNLKAVHNIPSIGFVITATANVTWRENSWAHYINDEIPVKYISVKDGKMYDFSPSMLEQDEFKALDVRPDLDYKRNIKDSYKTPILCMNVNVTKEIKDYLRVSFYANNAFRSTPLWESTKNPGSFTRRNANTFFFGLSLTAIIK